MPSSAPAPLRAGFTPSLSRRRTPCGVRLAFPFITDAHNLNKRQSLSRVRLVNAGIARKQRTHTQEGEQEGIHRAPPSLGDPRVHMGGDIGVTIKGNRNCLIRMRRRTEGEVNPQDARGNTSLREGYPRVALWDLMSKGRAQGSEPGASIPQPQGAPRGREGVRQGTSEGRKRRPHRWTVRPTGKHSRLSASCRSCYPERTPYNIYLFQRMEKPEAWRAYPHSLKCHLSTQTTMMSGRMLDEGAFPR